MLCLALDFAPHLTVRTLCLGVVLCGQHLQMDLLAGCIIPHNWPIGLQSVVTQSSCGVDNINRFRGVCSVADLGLVRRTTFGICIYNAIVAELEVKVAFISSVSVWFRIWCTFSFMTGRLSSVSIIFMTIWLVPSCGKPIPLFTHLFLFCFIFEGVSSFGTISGIFKVAYFMPLIMLFAVDGWQCSVWRCGLPVRGCWSPFNWNNIIVRK